jgi:hypothetical protein
MGLKDIVSGQRGGKRAAAISGCRRRPPPFDDGQPGCQHGYDGETNHDHRLDRTVVLIRIPSRDQLNPIGEEWSDERQYTCQQSQGSFDPEPKSKCFCHAHPQSLDYKRVIGLYFYTRDMDQKPFTRKRIFRAAR